jgi:hypothetical protein
MRKITMAQLSGLARTSEKVLATWIERLDLATKYQRAKTGPATGGRFTRENAIELFLIAKLVRLGLLPSMAAAHISSLLKQWARGDKLGLTFVSGPDIAITLDEPLSVEQITGLQREEIAFVLIDAAAAVAQVDTYFATLEPVSADVLRSA